MQDTRIYCIGKGIKHAASFQFAEEFSRNSFIIVGIAKHSLQVNSRLDQFVLALPFPEDLLVKISSTRSWILQLMPSFEVFYLENLGRTAARVSPAPILKMHKKTKFIIQGHFPIRVCILGYYQICRKLEFSDGN